MEFRRSGQRDDRRRRVLLEDGPRALTEASGDEAAAKRDRSPQRVLRYAEAARPEYQPRLTDLIPTRPWTLIVLGLLGLTGVALAQFLYIVVLQTPHVAQLAPLTPLDVAQRGSLANWLSCVVLLMAAAEAILIYTIRRHRVDDYRGRYRIWLPLALLLLLASVDAGCALHQCAGDLLVGLTHWTVLQTSTQWSTALIGILVTIVAIRLAFELRESRIALSALAVAVTLYTAHGFLALGMASTEIEFLDHSLQSTLLLLGHLASAAAITFFLRHVHLDAQGLLPERAAKQPRERRLAKPAKAKRRKETAAETDPPAKPRKPPRSRSDLDPATAQESVEATESPRKTAKPADERPKLRLATRDEQADEDADSANDANLSRAERRRLKKMQRRGQKAA